jgi:TonB family protein
MPPLTQEATPTGTGIGGPQRRTNAVGLEVPVVVHASRNSAVTRGATKNLPSVHEETRTVIVFQQGAVVRLTATMTQGEMVVLTNQQSGADVLCRVANIKTQPGIQNYVDLEFTQRAPGFWGDSFPEEGSPAQEAAVAPVRPAAAAVPLVESEGQRRTHPVAAKAPETALVPPVALPASSPVVPVATSMPAPAMEFKAAQQVVAPVGSGFEQPFETGMLRPRGAAPVGASFEPQPRGTPGFQKGLLMGVAATVLLILTVGEVLLYRKDQSSAGTSRASSVPAQPFQGSQPGGSFAGQPVAQSAGQADSGLVTVSVQPAVVTSAVNPGSQTPDVPAAGKSGDSARNGAPNAERRAGVAVEPISRPNVKRSLETGSLEPPPVLSAEASSMTMGTGLVANAGRDLVAPPPVGSGRVEAPKLLSSPSAMYPSLARARNVEGTVVVDAVVDVTGKVSETEVVSGPEILRQSAVDAVRSWKYQPGRLDGRPVAVHTKVNIEFRASGQDAVTGGTVTVPPVSSAAPASVTVTGARLEAPELIASPSAIYPATARANHVEGVVVMDALVDATGKVTQVKAISGPAPLQQAAVDALRSWKYQPARQDGQPVAQHTQVSISFRLQ